MRGLDLGSWSLPMVMRDEMGVWVMRLIGRDPDASLKYSILDGDKFNDPMLHGEAACLIY